MRGGAVSRKREPELVDLALEVRGETDLAFRLHDGSKTEWVPKRWAQDNGDGTFTIEVWKAKELGFI